MCCADSLLLLLPVTGINLRWRRPRRRPSKLPAAFLGMAMGTSTTSASHPSCARRSLWCRRRYDDNDDDSDDGDDDDDDDDDNDEKRRVDEEEEEGWDDGDCGVLWF